MPPCTGMLRLPASRLVEPRLKDTGRTAVIADIAAVEDRAIEYAEPYFRDMYTSAPAPPARLSTISATN